MLSIVRKVCRNIRLPKNMGGAQYLLHPPCGVIYIIFSLLISSVLAADAFFIAGRLRQAEPAATRSVICFGQLKCGSVTIVIRAFFEPCRRRAYAFFAAFQADIFVQNRL